ncbi:transposase [Gemmatimonas sp.]|uniref:transposase n=1 Tax=Gemmatimonas sp. TaxID=1962908 RepID=UPI00391EFE95
MLTWPHSGVHVHTAVWGPADDRAFATRLARYCTRSPVARERRTYDRTAKAVTYRSDKSEGPTAGTETIDPLECLARVLVRIPDKGHVTTRYDGWYANRPRGILGAHSGQGPRHHAVLWLVCQSPTGHAGEGGDRNGGRAAGDGCRSAVGADRGRPPVGDAPPADL